MNKHNLSFEVIRVASSLRERRRESGCLYLAFHKPYRVLSCFTDPEGRPTLADYIPVPGVYAAGRLDSVPIRYRLNVPTAWLRVTLRERHKRQLRHMTAAVGHPTLRLVRAGIGPVQLGDLPPGHWRELTSEELAALSAMLRRPSG